MKYRFSLGLAALLQLGGHSNGGGGGAFALRTTAPPTDDGSSQLLTTTQPKLVAPRQDDGWEGVTPQLAEAAIDAMNKVWYNETDGRWDSVTAWWLTGNALQSVCDYMYATGDTQYLAQAEYTLQAQSGVLDWWPQGGGNYRADSTDDTAWWALALIRMYDLTGNTTYLDVAAQDEAYIYQYWNSTCGGGVLWSIRNLEYKNAISNELYIKLAASLHNRLGPGSSSRTSGRGGGLNSTTSSSSLTYLAKAQTAWTWFNRSGMINRRQNGLINDGLANNCTNNGQPQWTYNQGVILGAAAELYRATNDTAYLDTAQEIADAVLAANDTLSPDGILYEYPCDDGTGGCDTNQFSFKGIFARNLAELAAVLPDGGPRYAAYLAANAKAAWTYDRDDDEDLYGLSWAGPYQAATSAVGTQSSVISLFVANLWS